MRAGQCLGRWGIQFTPFRPSILRRKSNLVFLPESRSPWGVGVFSFYKMSLAVRLELWKNTLGCESGDLDAILGLIVTSCVTLSK